MARRCSGITITPGPFSVAVAIVATAVMLLFDRQFEDDGGTPPDMAGAFARTAVWLVIGLTAAK